LVEQQRRCDRVDGHHRRLLRIGVGWNDDQFLGGNQHSLLPFSNRKGQDDAVADFQAGDPGPDALDDSSHFCCRRKRERRLDLVFALNHQDVEEIQRRCLDRNDSLTWLGNRIGHVRQHEIVRTEAAHALQQAARAALAGLLQRDLVVLWKNKLEFVTRTLVQPFLLVFVFLYVFIWVRATLPRYRYDQLMRIMEADKVEVEEGDLVCFLTGYDRVILGMNKSPDAAVLAANPGAGLDGRDERLLNWITRSGAVALISDNRAVEQMPSRPCEGEDHCASLPLHAHCLFKLGVYLGEIWHLSDLADWLRAHGRSRFLLTAPPLRLPGAVGSPANAIATV